MVSMEEIRNNRDEFLSQNKKYGELALKNARGVKDYKELSKKINCPLCTASTILNQLLNYNLHEKGKNGLFRKTKGLISIGIKPNTIEAKKVEKKIRTRKIKKYDTSSIKREIKKYILGNFKKIIHPFDQTKSISIPDKKLELVSEILFSILETDLKFEKLEGLEVRFYESVANYFSKNRMYHNEMIIAFSSLVGNFEPYIKAVALIKTEDINKAKLSLGKELIKIAMQFESNLKNTNDGYWSQRPINESCIRFIYPFRHIESHEARNWKIFEMEKVIYYMFASIILINLEYSKLKKD